MGPSVFLAVSLFFVVFGLQRRLLRLPLRPVVLNLPVIFSGLFFLYYSQHYFLSEVVFETPVMHWLPLTESQKALASSFLLSYLAVFWVGFLLYPKKRAISQIGKPTNYAAFGVLFSLVTITAFIVYIQTTGGLESFVTNHREAIYQDQWSRSAEAIASVRMRMITNGIMLAAVLVGGYLAGVHTRAARWQRLLYFLLPLPATLIKVALVSRGFFLWYAVFFLTMSVSSQKKTRFFALKLAAISILLIWGVVTALVLRSGVEPTFSSMEEILMFASLSINGLSGVLDSYALRHQGGGEGVLRVLLELSPVPSFIFSMPYDNNLASLVFSSNSGSSAPMPFIGEAYYNLGWYGLILAAIQGYFAAHVNTRVATVSGRRKFWWVLLYITTVYSFIYMPHSGLRSCTRLMVWVLIAFGIREFLTLLTQSSRRHEKAARLNLQDDIAKEQSLDG